MNATAAQTKSLEWLNRLRANPKNSIDCCRFRGSGGHGRTDSCGRKPPTTAHYSAIFPIRMVAQLSAN
ncbi:flagellar M-ring protein [Escherichia coli]|uniref:Flagellar M-ring protein n=1 Tax=Escherichia coli TaxID=562 RepID=A0A376KS40_ECOLX|nr:flagellar M-ring protein [Escherichia coli]